MIKIGELLSIVKQHPGINLNSLAIEMDTHEMALLTSIVNDLGKIGQLIVIKDVQDLTFDGMRTYLFNGNNVVVSKWNIEKRIGVYSPMFSVAQGEDFTTNLLYAQAKELFETHKKNLLCSRLYVGDKLLDEFN